MKWSLYICVGLLLASPKGFCVESPLLLNHTGKPVDFSLAGSTKSIHLQSGESALTGFPLGAHRFRIHHDNGFWRYDLKVSLEEIQKQRASEGRTTKFYLLPNGGLYAFDQKLGAAEFDFPYPQPRFWHTAVWTGSEMIIWGGQSEATPFFQDGWAYSPNSNQWRRISSQNAPSARCQHSAIWTGSKMIIWGGCSSYNPPVCLYDGAAYDPASDTWTSIAASGAPSGRKAHSAVWTNSKMIIWGGNDGTQELKSGGIYDPNLDRWDDTTDEGAPDARSGHTAVWDPEDSLMIVWGGATQMNSGGSYSPGTGVWKATSLNHAPSGRSRHTAIWENGEMIVWGGAIFGGFSNDGARYNPVTDSWVAAQNVPAGRAYHTAVWTGQQMCVWGGMAADLHCGCGARYEPQFGKNGRWLGMASQGTPPGQNEPGGRWEHSAVWTGSEMIVWGGRDNNGSFGDGGRYDPQPDYWKQWNPSGATRVGTPLPP